MTYRRRVKSDVWHWIPECRWWPVKDAFPLPFVERQVKPKSGELCDECIRRQKRENK